MRFTTTLATVASLAMSARAEVHGASAEGTVMGPVAFLWPDDRPWSASNDNSGPCGSAEGVTNRTEFPLSQGQVALSIADDAYKVAFYIAFDNEPTTQSDFTEQIVQNITEVEPGHQCYKIASLPSTATAGTNATIQLAYWADYEGENGGKNETFYACADITLVEAADFSAQVPCFNVTAADFDSGDATATETVASATVTPTSATASSSGSGGLSKGAVAGIAVGTIVGSLAVVGAFAFMLLKRRRSSAAAASTLPTQAAPMKQREGDVASVSTGH
ncbi:hypothetical protein J7T55_010260 [Diaporthe amygdali]|uniref:uncharacterized protein n=1 Tax=Phomopsis amygdali TaxID=1214568 RepID=UPI0022FEDB63|nr:uncharacterized protein J7T55_010260 [Diaporthe amygdali]KAJ0107655.1 hypothetical protein J7T55_010260 [Diaporthe amygdali]